MGNCCCGKNEAQVPTPDAKWPPKEMGDDPMIVKCPLCKKTITTQVRQVPAKFYGFQVPKIVNEDNKNSLHFCPECKGFLGYCKKF